MKFLVILLALAINHYWARDRDLFDDTWFVRLQNWLESRLAAFTADHSGRSWILPALLLAIPTVVLLLILALFQGIFLGLVTLAIQVAVLLLLFDRINMTVFTAQYLECWRAGNYEGAFLKLQQRELQPALDTCEDIPTLHHEFCRFLVSSYFERLFAVVFWYLLLGPAGALFYHLATLCRDKKWQLTDSGEDQWILRLVYVMEWVPARLLGLTFSLAGDFVAAFSRLSEVLMEMDRSALNLVQTCALAAVGFAHKTMLVQDRKSVPVKGEGGHEALTTILVGAESEPDEGIFALRAAQQAEDLLGLLNRSQIIWLSVLALLALYGIGN